MTTPCNGWAAGNTNKGGKEGIDFQFHCVGSEAVDSVVTGDIGLGGLTVNFISFRPTLQLQVTTPCNGWAAGNTNKGGKEGIDFQFHCVGSEAVDSVVTGDIGLGGLTVNFISFRPTLQLQVTTPCNGWAAGKTNRGGKEGIAFLFYYV